MGCKCLCVTAHHVASHHIVITGSTAGLRVLCVLGSMERTTQMHPPPPPRDFPMPFISTRADWLLETTPEGTCILYMYLYNTVTLTNTNSSGPEPFGLVNLLGLQTAINKQVNHSKFAFYSVVILHQVGYIAVHMTGWLWSLLWSVELQLIACFCVH